MSVSPAIFVNIWFKQIYEKESSPSCLDVNSTNAFRSTSLRSGYLRKSACFHSQKRDFAISRPSRGRTHTAVRTQVTQAHYVTLAVWVVLCYKEVCMGTQRFCLKTLNVWWIKLTNPVSVLYSLSFACPSGRFNVISVSLYRCLGVPTQQQG